MHGNHIIFKFKKAFVIVIVAFHNTIMHLSGLYCLEMDKKISVTNYFISVRQFADKFPHKDFDFMPLKRIVLLFDTLNQEPYAIFKFKNFIVTLYKRVAKIFNLEIKIYWYA